MAVDITVEINTLRTATYGEEVRDSLANALDKLQRGVNSASGGSSVYFDPVIDIHAVVKNSPEIVEGDANT